MTNKLMRDSVTDKLMRDDITGKLMRAMTVPSYGYSESDCEYCVANETPNRLWLITKNLEFCSECYNSTFPPFESFTFETPAVNPLGVHELIQSGVAPCLWTKWDATATGYVTGWSQDNCEGTDTLVGGGATSWEVKKISNTLAEIEIRIGAYWAFFATNIVVDSGCIGIVSAENTLSCGLNGKTGMYSGGTATVIELI